MPRSVAELHDTLGALRPPRPRDKAPYVDKLELTRADEPALLEILKLWIVAESERELKDSAAWYAPIHALRSLAQLGAASVISATLALLDTLDAQGDQWYLEEFPDVCAQIGEEALAPLTAYLADASHAEFPRIAVAHSLREVAQHHPHTRDQVVDALVGVLAPHDVGAASLSGFVIGYLVDLRATEHEDAIHAAYLAQCVDTMVCGDWKRISQELHTGRRPMLRNSPMLRDSWMDFNPPPAQREEPVPKRKVVPKQDKAARKRSKDARKRNRSKS